MRLLEEESIVRIDPLDDPDNEPLGIEGHGKASYIRNCFIDCGIATPNPDPSIGKYRGVSMSWCRGGVIEGNHIQNCDIGGPYVEDQRNTRDIIVRNNFFKNVGRGPYWNLGASSKEDGPGALSRSDTVGTISGISGLGSYDVGVRVKLVTTPPDYNGLYVIQTKTDTAFTITVPIDKNPLVEATSVRKVFGVSRAIVEGNIIELAQVSGAVAVAVADNNDFSPYTEAPDHVHGDIIIRNNRVRYVDGAAPNDGGAVLIDLRGVQNVIVQSNVLDTIATLPIHTARCGAQSYFDNRTVAGALITVAGFTAEDFQEILDIPSDEAFTLSCFHHY